MKTVISFFKFIIFILQVFITVIIVSIALPFIIIKVVLELIWKSLSETTFIKNLKT